MVGGWIVTKGPSMLSFGVIGEEAEKMTGMCLWLLLLLPAQDGWPDTFTTHFKQGKPLTTVFAGDAAAAGEARRQIIETLSQTEGGVVGYKAALTSRAVQRRLGVNEPVYGALFAATIVNDGAVIQGRYGAVPMFEADLVLRVKDPALINATTRAEALAGVDAVIPFLELPDLFYAPGQKLTGAAVAAVNAGTRLGVMGRPVPLRAGVDWITRLAEFKVHLTGDGVSARGQGSDLLGHPLDALLWLTAALKADGITLKKGDLLSLGSLTPMMPYKGQSSLTVAYAGLALKPPTVSVRFEKAGP